MKTTLFAALMLLSAQASFAQNEIIVGDMNDDNQLNIEDVSSLVSTVLGKTKVRKVAVSGSGNGGRYGAYATDNTDLLGSWYVKLDNGSKGYYYFEDEYEYSYDEGEDYHKYASQVYKYQPALARIVFYNSNGSVNAVRSLAEIDATHFVMCLPEDQKFIYFYRNFNSNMSAPEMTSSEGWTQTGDWSTIENGSTEAYGGWNANTNNDYNTHQTVTLAKGTYKLTGYAFYRSGETFNEDAETSLAYMYAGNKSVKVMTLGSIERSFYPNTIATANEAFYTDGDYKNVLYFTVDEDNTEVEIGYKGTHDASKSKSWFICGALNLEYLFDHEYVDLGLPSGTLWATMNVGANSPEEYGGYYAWGESSAYGEAPSAYLKIWRGSKNPNYLSQTVKTEYSWNTYKWGTSEDDMFKYKTTESTTLTETDDAAYVNWGENWRMPTKEEIDELHDNCKWAWTTLNGVKGYKVTGTNGNSIFLPSAGYRELGSGNAENESGRYWSKTLFSYAWGSGSAISFADDYYQTTVGFPRCDGFSVRPVRRK